MITVAVDNARDPRFRHVVFTGRRSGSPLNLAPQSASASSGSITEVVAAPTARDPAAHRLAADEAAFVDWIFDLAALDARAYRPETLSRRLPACLRALRVNSIAKARRAVEGDPARVNIALGAMLIGVSGFFRDASVFDALRHSVLPQLPHRAAHPRVWSVGCSDGQELYSVAMLLREAGLLGGAALLGTDCRAAALARARSASYEDAALRDVPSDLREKYFFRDGTMWRVVNELRGAVQWRRGDATRLTEPGAWDLILCRNVSMYLRGEVATRLRQVCEQSLRVGGFLVFGKAERPSGSTRLSQVAPCIYRKE